MKPYTRSIIDLFDSKRRYLIPLYQRQYAWKIEPQLRLLWEDIIRANKRLIQDRATLTPHFMGAMVISQIKTFGKQVQAYEVIDGQQRLTTFQLLLAALRDVARANGSTYAEEIDKHLVNEGVMETPSIERYKVWPSLMDRRAFVGVIDPNANLEEIAKPPTDEDGVVRRSVAAHAWFLEKIKAHVGIGNDYDESALEKLYEALKEGLAVVSIELETGDDPQTIFETLNSRGVDLTPGDLMRNFIFQRAKGMGQADASLIVDQLYEKHWLPLDGAFWQEQATRGRQSAARIDWMLTDHLSMSVAEIVSKESLFDSYRKWINREDPFATVSEELESISLSAEVERRIFERSTADVIGRFGLFAEAFDVSTVFPLVVYLATEAEVEGRLDEALGIVESYILRRDLCGLSTKNYNRFFVSLVSRLRDAEGDKVDALKDWLASRTTDLDRWPLDQEWQSAWINRAQYRTGRQARLRFIFERLEQRKRTKLNEEIEIRSILSIEHIMPQKWRANWPVAGFEHLGPDEIDQDELIAIMNREGVINLLGNLTLVTSPLNSSVSNGPFSTKMPALRAHSSLSLNRELNDFDHWDEAAIAARGSALFETARTIWIRP